MSGRQPCPGRIFEDLGVGFSIGCFFGSFFYFIKGAYNAPRRKRFIGGLTHIRNRAPTIGGSFAMWGGCFSSIDCLMMYYRQKDDPFNLIASGFLTGGILAFRSGPQAAFKNAMIGGIMLALIEGVTVFFTQWSMRMQQTQMEEQMALQKAELDRMLRRGGTDPWAVDYDAKIAGKDLQDPDHQMKDNASTFGGGAQSSTESGSESLFGFGGIQNIKILLDQNLSVSEIHNKQVYIEGSE